MSLVFVTGGSRGLGFETAKGLIKAGHQVVLFAKNEERLKSAAAELNSNYLVVDLENILQTREVFKAAIEKFGVPEILMLAHGEIGRAHV